MVWGSRVPPLNKKRSGLRGVVPDPALPRSLPALVSFVLISMNGVFKEEWQNFITFSAPPFTSTSELLFVWLIGFRSRKTEETYKEQ